MADNKPRWFAGPQTVTQPSTNLARRRPTRSCLITVIWPSVSERRVFCSQVNGFYVTGRSVRDAASSEN